MSHVHDSKALEFSREVIALMYGKMPPGGSVQLQAEIQCMFVDAMGFAEASNYPVIPDGWVSVSERMPENKPGSYEYIVFESLNNRAHHDYWNVPDGSCDDFSPFWNHYGKYVTHWMPLPAAPQQECKHEFVYGWHSYGSKSGYQCRFCGKLQEVKL
ncbi:hypothetical protein TUM17564_39270 [Citrobacter freundii]|uniref:DUF551 domain-containing protein n=1 Tax=Citrobacter freundii TaxID=546 RepID=UPI001E606497|nr:DUF551 domain-containing protein [Citrobacter freundii]GJK71900.1 hypothetical protein TUM17564_39270 [Citrobacter freundii]